MELRLYSFVNYYLSSIQQGIQTGHVAVELVRKYTKDDSHPGHQITLVEDWADNHKTFITLNGGNNAGVHEAAEILVRSGLPMAFFREDEQSLGQMLTSAAVIVPEYIFNARFDKEESAKWKETRYVYNDPTGCQTPILYGPSHPSYEIVNLLKNSRLAS
jgi:hypothetical protein